MSSPRGLSGPLCVVELEDRHNAKLTHVCVNVLMCQSYGRRSIRCPNQKLTFVLYTQTSIPDADRYSPYTFRFITSSATAHFFCPFGSVLEHWQVYIEDQQLQLWFHTPTYICSGHIFDINWPKYFAHKACSYQRECHTLTCSEKFLCLVITVKNDIFMAWKFHNLEKSHTFAIRKFYDVQNS